MKPPSTLGNLNVYGVVIRLAALGVPRSRRQEWMAEWMAELWYVRETLALRNPTTSVAHREIAAFCRGAIDDVRCLRNLHACTPVKASGSAVTCMVSLSLLCLLCFTVAQFVPAVHHVTERPPYRDAANLVSIWQPGEAGTWSPPVRLGAVRSWRSRPQHLFSEFAFYAPAIKSVHIGGQHAAELAIARSSANLLTLLGVPVRYRQPARPGDGLPVLILNESTWRSQFGADREVFGRTLKVGLQAVRLGGMVSDQTTPAGAHVDAWLLLPESAAEALPNSTRVFVIAHNASPSVSGFSAEQRWHMTVPGSERTTEYECVALSARNVEPQHLFVFAVFLALLSLPAVTTVTLGEYAARPVKLSKTITLRRWLFLIAKFSLLLPAIYFGTMDLAYAFSWSPSASQYIQLGSVFCATLFALQWALRDQCQRCPVCLSKLKCPARVGQPSRNFLTWNGTELICTDGHGLLHVPELPTSWFSEPRWLHLDSSWRSLFLRPA
jgi:hypothetical protein